MSEANPALDPIGYRCDGCGRLFQDPYADLSAIRAAGGMSCCPERKPVGLSDRIKELEAKLTKSEALLAKAVGNLASVMSRYDRFREDEYAVGLAPLDGAIETARTALAELTKERSDEKGETDE